MPLLFIILFSLALSACTGTHNQPQASVAAIGDKVADPHHAIQMKLYRQYAAWRGTRYQLGGLSKNGIDCSGFVHLTFLTQFRTQLPRTTADQIHAGHPIHRSALAPGDLVFFKTGQKVRHVGIYLDDQQFLHASTSRGVIISRLDNPYWKAAYWQARRLQLPRQTV